MTISSIELRNPAARVAAESSARSGEHPAGSIAAESSARSGERPPASVAQPAQPAVRAELAHEPRGAGHALLRLLQLTSPALPIGAYAYSQALEPAVHRGWVSNAGDLRAWLAGLLDKSIARVDLPLVLRHYRAWSSGDTAQVLHWSRVLRAFRESRELLEQEQQLGSALARVLVKLGIEAAAPFVVDAEATHCSMYALAARHWNIELELALPGYAFAWLENQIGAAMRLLPLGQLGAQELLSDLQLEISSAVALAESLTDDGIGSVLPGVGLVSAWHEEQYSRLFRS